MSIESWNTGVVKSGLSEMWHFADDELTILVFIALHGILCFFMIFATNDVELIITADANKWRFCVIHLQGAFVYFFLFEVEFVNIGGYSFVCHTTKNQTFVTSSIFYSYSLISSSFELSMTSHSLATTTLAMKLLAACIAQSSKMINALLRAHQHAELVERMFKRGILKEWISVTNSAVTHETLDRG